MAGSKLFQFLLKQFAHRLAGCPAGDTAANPFGHLLGAAAGDRLYIAKQAS
jgi:hypothetical protein